MMKTTATLVLSLVFVAALAGTAPAVRQHYSHQDDYFEHYEGTRTCLECHEQEAQDFFHSQHYQWRGKTPNVVNADGMELGKLNTMNDFCTNPNPSWIGNAVNEDGKIIAQGCSKCHAGLGAKPQAEMTQAQLENIDCLICHASGYRRDLYKDDAGQWEWRPILWKNQAGLDAISKRIVLPQRTMCLRCHSGAGGGQNFKRGDLEYELKECETEFDVHMATEGNDLQCIDCHQGEDHRIVGRGVDLPANDLPDRTLRCTSCHDERPHDIAALDNHTDRVYCTVCHIPTFAKKDATDMVRDWSQPKYHPDSKKYSATITFGKDVVPVYAWYNGQSKAAILGQRMETDKNGVYTMMGPVGDKGDKSARIYAFKLHKGVLPMLKKEQRLIPIGVDEFFIDGNIAEAVARGASSTYGIGYPEYEWINVRRYMGIFHEVQPAANALQCLDCHREGGRMDWKALGYKRDPLLDAMD
ncbi:hypothetical protein CO151_00120 [bacterium CG_4_9_14_3_um_filter_65_15]|nr:MAG: hypothetical protein CO151_00120 [bacterium CG_4_9_14_3_um_filter_65_15]